MASTTPNTFQEGTFNVAPRMNLYYRDYGSANRNLTPVICLHGYWRNSRDFEELAMHIAGTRRVVTPDLRGRGRSSRTTDAEEYRFELLAADVIKLLNALGIPRAVFIGTALGSHLAMEIANIAPTFVAGILMNDSGPEANPAASAHMAKFSGADEISYEEALERTRAQYAYDCPRFGEQDWIRYVYRAYRQNEAGKYVRDFHQLTNVDLRRLRAERPTFWTEYDGLKEIPVAILRGANSRYLTEDIASRMIAAKASARLYTIPDVGHPCSLYEPESFAAVDDLLALVDKQEQVSNG